MSNPAPGEARPPRGVTKRMLPALRRELEEERERLRALAERLEADVREQSWDERVSDDEVEVGSATSERERAISLAKHARTQLAFVEQALSRMDAGQYGACVSCGQLIERARLEARPQSLLCLTCQRAEEGHR